MPLTAEQRYLLAVQAQRVRDEKAELERHNQQHPDRTPIGVGPTVELPLAVADHMTAMEGLLGLLREALVAENLPNLNDAKTMCRQRSASDSYFRPILSAHSYETGFMDGVLMLAEKIAALLGSDAADAAEGK